jgi:hypothetical protein
MRDKHLGLKKLFGAYLPSNVADPECLSRILNFTHPGSRISDPGSRIPDPKTAMKDRGEKIFFVISFFLEP